MSTCSFVAVWPFQEQIYCSPGSQQPLQSRLCCTLSHPRPALLTKLCHKADVRTYDRVSHYKRRQLTAIAVTVFSVASEENSDSDPTEKCTPSISESSSCSNQDVKAQELTLDLSLPRRRVEVSFTCNACGFRSQRLINPHAYERGTVFVQCAGCDVYHKLVDNLSLIVEYDFRECTDSNKKGEADTGFANGDNSTHKL